MNCKLRKRKVKDRIHLGGVMLEAAGHLKSVIKGLPTAFPPEV